MTHPSTVDAVQLTTLVVRDFRNLASVNVDLPPDGMVILGENGHGKTNFLEAIYYLVLFRSLRGAKDRDLVRFGAPGFFVAGDVDVHVTVGYEVEGRRKKVTVDHAERSKLSDAVGHVTAVPFAPSDRDLVAGGPAGRRRYLDIVLALSEPGYLSALTSMRQALKQRNAALRLGRGDAARAFDAPFAEFAAPVAAARRQWVDRWSDRFRELSTALGEDSGTRIVYRPDHHREDDVPDHIRAALRAGFERDQRRGTTTTGPHRDDVTLTLADRDLRVYGSAGQQRTAAIALRLLEAETLRAARGVAPLALYDDVFAELDRGRQERLLGLIRESLPGQAIVTAPRESEVPSSLLGLGRWRMHRGSLERR